MGGLRGFGEPSLPFNTAADPRTARQPFSQPLGTLTGAPSRTRLTQLQVTPRANGTGVLQTPTILVEATRENRIVTLTAPWTNFVIYVGNEPSLNLLSALSLPPGLPYEISLAGNQALYAVTDAPVFLTVRIQIAPAIASDTERRLTGL